MSFSDMGVRPAGAIRTDLFTVRPLLVSDAELDYEAVMDSREILRQWEGDDWPADDFTLDANRDDMVTMHERHSSNYAFGYTIMNPAETECLGCVYIFPPDAKMYADVSATPLGDQSWKDVEATVFFWVRKSRLADGLDRAVVEALRPWLDNDWAFDRYVFVTRQAFEQQVAMFDGTDLQRRFELTFAEDSVTSLAFA